LQASHVPLEVANHKVANLVKLSNVNHFNEVLDNILVPRVVGTPGHDKVRDYIVKTMKALNWDVSLDTFQDKTPNMGTLTFDNIIAKLNPKAERYLMIACHYDSKWFADREFLGATDSAVPCALMVNMAHIMARYLDQNRQNNELSLMFVFFDGEEAFLNWSATDSIYGARHLAQKWEQENFLQRIDMMVLLDLLGAPDPNFYSFFQNTENWYVQLCKAEEKLEQSGHFEDYQYSSAINRTPKRYFNMASQNSYIEDDHIPFLRRGVSILHVIPTPFPEVWHKFSDDKSAVDTTAVENLSKIFRIFLVEYLHIEV
jgi:glutaminyl-peptide cyclotransferase